jgi:anti-sigma regulatory factor (Ser/Thr protein kinase)
MAIPEPVLGASMFIFFALLFVTGLKLVFQSGINSRSAFITGISFWIGFAAENRLFFPDFIPAGTEAFLHNGMAVGGVTAFLLTLLFELFVGKKTTLVLAPNLQELSKLKDFTADLGSVFNLSDKMIFRLQLLCEEIFVFLVGSEPPENSQQKTIRFNFTAGEEGLLVEVKDRSETEDLDAVVFPENLAVASESELAKLGLALLGKMAQEVAHIRISGVNYISFRLWDSEDQNTAKA